MAARGKSASADDDESLEYWIEQNEDQIEEIKEIVREQRVRLLVSIAVMVLVLCALGGGVFYANYKFIDALLIASLNATAAVALWHLSESLTRATQRYGLMLQLDSHARRTERMIKPHRRTMLAPVSRSARDE